MKHTTPAHCLTILAAVSILLAGDALTISVDVTDNPLNIALSADGTTFMEIVKLNLGGREITSVADETTEGNDLVLSFDGDITLRISPVHRGIHFHSENDGAGEFRVEYKDNGEHFYGVSGESYFEMCVTNNNRYDWTDANFKSWFEQKLKENQYQYGIMGHKIDRAGFYTPGSFDDGTPRVVRACRGGGPGRNIVDHSFRPRLRPGNVRAANNRAQR